MPPWQNILISQIVAGLKRNYIFPDKIDANFELELRKKFEEKFSGPEYSIEPGGDGKDFALQVGIILRELVGDEHLELFYDPELIGKHEDFLRVELKFPWELPLSDPRNFPEALKETERVDLEKIGCGYYDLTTDASHIVSKVPEARKAERRAEVEKEKLAWQDKIAADIGYIGISFVADPITFPVVGEKIFDTMHSMRDKKALILDLRGNTGGAPEGVRHLLSYLLKEGVHINTIKKRKEGEFEYEVFKTHGHSSVDLNPATRLGREVPDLSEKLLYVLIDQNTFSAGEEIAYDLQQLDRATLIGEPSRGGAHPMRMSPLFIDRVGGEGSSTVNSHFIMSVPDSMAVNPITGTNWEDQQDIGKGKGVRPDISVAAEHALPKAVEEIQRRLAVEHTGSCVSKPATLMRDKTIPPHGPIEPRKPGELPRP